MNKPSHRRRRHPRPMLVVLLIAALTSACTSDVFEAAPDPVPSLASPLAQLVQSDLGQYYAAPRADLTDEELSTGVAKLRTMPGVQSVVREPDGRINVEFTGRTTAEQREAVVKQLAALGEVEEGI